MIPSLTSLLSTVAGKVAAGVVVATTSVGAAAAAGAPVPLLTPPEDRPPVEVVGEPAPDEPAADEEGLLAAAVGEPAVDEEPPTDEPEDPNHGEVVSDFVASAEAMGLEGCEKGQATAAVARGDLDPSDPDFEAELATHLDESGKCLDDESDEDPIEDESAEPTHGDVVSGFVHETELEGCLKGQATAAVARGDVEPDGDGAIDHAAIDAYLAESDACANDEGDADSEGDPEVSESEASDVDEDVRPENAGPPPHAGKPDHAGPPAGRGPDD